MDLDNSNIVNGENFIFNKLTTNQTVISKEQIERIQSGYT